MKHEPVPLPNLAPKVARRLQEKGHAHRAFQAQPDRIFNVLQSGDVGEIVWCIDGYRIVDEMGHERWRLHLICPYCGGGLTVESAQKALRVTKAGLEVEAFRCAWGGDFGEKLCNFACGIRLPRDGERVVACDGDPKPYKIDGVMVPA